MSASALALLFSLLGGSPPVGFVSAGQACTGDCDGDGAVTIDEVVRAVGIGVGTLPLQTCPAADRNGDGVVLIDEAIGSVDAGLAGCATPIPTPTTPPSPDTCIEIAGEWISAERGSTTCQVAGSDEPQGREFEGSEEIEITQDGCVVHYQIPSSNLEREGVVGGDHVSFFGPMFESETGVTYRVNTTMIEGVATADRIDLAASGRAAGTVNDSGDFSCVASSVVTFTRTP